MRILLLTHYFSPEVGAPQRRWHKLIERFANAGHVIDVICPPPHYPGGVYDSAQNPGLGSGSSQRFGPRITVHRVGYVRHDGSIGRRTIDHVVTAQQTVRRANRLIRSNGSPDVIVATAPAIETLVAGALLSKRRGVPLVSEMRDAWPDLLVHTPGLDSSGALVHRLKKLVHQGITRMQLSASSVVVTTRAFAEILAARGVRRVTVVRNGTSLERYSGLIGPAGNVRPLRALYIGTIGRSQGLEVAIEAAQLLRASGREIELRLVGTGADLRRLQRVNNSLGDVAQILDAVPPEDVRAHYEWADTVIVSLRDWEPFQWTVPSKLYEAMATGRHVTALLAGEAASIVEESGAGTVVRPGDSGQLAAVWAGLQADRRLLEVGSGGRHWVARHADFDALAQRYLDLLESVVENGATSDAA